MKKSEFENKVIELGGVVVIDDRKESHQYVVIVPSPKAAMDHSVERYSRGCFSEDVWKEIVSEADFHASERD